MSKIIVDNRSKKHSDEIAFLSVIEVIKKGRISDEGKSYCFAHTFFVSDVSKIVVYAKRNKLSDTFRVEDYEE